jgi:quercetin dioxygenase-like cupin family protein
MSDRATHYRWDDLPREELNPQIGRRFITGDSMMIAHIYLAKGAVVPKHEHVNEQLTYVIEGLLRFSLGDGGSQIVDVAAGEVLQIPAHLPHSAEALEDTLDVDVFHPPRQDWLDGSDAYLRETL